MAHIVQALTSENPEILSMDGIGAYDFISRNAICQGVRDMVDGGGEQDDRIHPSIPRFPIDVLVGR